MSIRFINKVPNINFVRQRWWAFAVIALLALLTVGSLAVNGLNLGIDFKGGIVLEVKAPAAVDTAQLRDQLYTLNLGDVEIQQFGAPDTVLIRLQMQDGGEAAQNEAVTKVRASLGETYEYRRVEVVGPRVGEELFNAGMMATFAAMLLIGIYVTMRFEWQFGLAALIATFHDVFLTLGLYSVLQLDFNLTAVAALLTLAGYSINDTVVIFDRIRENMYRTKHRDLKAIINEAVNQTLARTLMTAGTTLMALLPLVFFGGESLLNFSLALTWGIVIGTFSSIYVAAATLLYMKPLKQLQTVQAEAR